MGLSEMRVQHPPRADPGVSGLPGKGLGGSLALEGGSDHRP